MLCIQKQHVSIKKTEKGQKTTKTKQIKLFTLVVINYLKVSSGDGSRFKGFKQLLILTSKTEF
jgi:hypothetical protein